MVVKHVNNVHMVHIKINLVNLYVKHVYKDNIMMYKVNHNVNHVHLVHLLIKQHKLYVLIVILVQLNLKMVKHHV